MNINGGGLSFDITATNKNLITVLSQSKDAIQNFNAEAKKGGDGVEKAFNTATAVIGKLRDDLDKTDVAWTQTFDAMTAKLAEVKAARDKAWSEGNDSEFGKLQQQTQHLERQVESFERLGKHIGECYGELDREEAALRRNYEATKTNEQATASLKSQLRECVAKLAEMEAAGKRDTAEFKELQKEAGRLTDAIGDARTQARIFSHDNANLQGVISGIQGVTGAFTMAQGAAALFGEESEDLQKTMMKVQAAMSITMGLQQVYNTLNKDSAFMLTTVRTAKDALTAANARLAAALGVSTVAAQALMATLTLGLSVAITAIIAIIARMRSESEKAKKAQEEFNNKVAETAGKPLAAYAALQAEWLSLSGSLKDREKWVQDNADKFENLGFSVSNAKEAEDILIKNTAKFVEACMLKAKALAAQELAAEKYKEILKKQAEYDAMPYTKTRYVPNQFGMAMTYEVENGDKADLKKEIDALKADAKRLIEEQVKFNREEQAMLASIGNQAGKVVAGSVAEAEGQLSHLQKLYKNAGTQAERDDLYKKIQAQQKKVDQLNRKGTGGGSHGGNGRGGSGTGDTNKDPYLEQLQQRKEAYENYARWVQSEDATVRAAAATEFANILKDGSSYLDYLEKQRATIEAKAKKTATDLKQLSTINNEIASVTKKTVLDDFTTQLNTELSLCKTISEKLDLLEQRRAELSGDNSELDNAKSAILSGAVEDTKKQAKEETAALLQEYAGYINEKLKFEESYARKRDLLLKAKSSAKTDDEKAAAEAALAALDRKRKEYAQQSGNEDYDNLLQEYRNYEQQKEDIAKKYAEQRALAEQQGNLSMLSQINAKEQAELSKLAAARIMASESWTQLFGDLSSLSAKTINKLMADINSQKVTLSANFNPSDLKAIQDQLEKAKEEIHKRNPFAALKDGLADLRAAMKDAKILDTTQAGQDLKDLQAQYAQYAKAVESNDKTLAASAKEIYADLLKNGSSYLDALRRKLAELQHKKITIGLDVEGEEQLAAVEAALRKEEGTSKTASQAMKATFESVGSSIDFVKGCFDSVVGGMKKMGITMDEETEVIVGDIGEMLGGAAQLAEGIASGNPLAIVQGSISLLTSAIDIFNSGDRKAERSIKKHEQAITRLGYAYNELEQKIKHALGEEVYKNQSAEINNLKQQQKELLGMISDEKGKKHTDWDRVAEFEEQYREAARQIEDIIAEITANITTTTAKDLAGNIADALVEAFGEGKDAAEAFGQVANDVIKSAVTNALKLQFLEKPLQAAIQQLQRDMGYDENGNGFFDGLSEAEQKRFKDAVQAAGANFQQAMEVYKDLFAQLDENDPSTLSGAIKGASQESIDLLAGQANAVRMNQVTSLALIREQLTHLAGIDSSARSIDGKLTSLINALTTPSNDGLRGQGLTD